MGGGAGTGKGVQNDGIRATQYLHQELDQFCGLGLREDPTFSEDLTQFARPVRIEANVLRVKERVRRLPFLDFGEVPLGSWFTAGEVKPMVFFHLA